MFTPGPISAHQAGILNEMLKAYTSFGNRVSVTGWPLTIARPGRLQGQIIGIDPKAFPRADTGDGTGSGGQIVVIPRFCLNESGGGGAIRYKAIDLDTGEIVDQWCEDIPICGSGEFGNLCDDLPSGSGSGSGSGGGEVPPCIHAPDVLDYSIAGGTCLLGGVIDGHTGMLTRVGSADEWHDGTGGPCSCDGPFIGLTCSGGTWYLSLCDGACAGVLVSWTSTSLTFTVAGPCSIFIAGPITVTVAW